MKTKTWTVTTNTGKQADLESGLEKKEVQKPTHISAKEFLHWLGPESRIDDDSLRSLLNSKSHLPRARTPPPLLNSHYQVSFAVDVQSFFQSVNDTNSSRISCNL